MFKVMERRSVDQYLLKLLASVVNSPSFLQSGDSRIVVPVLHALKSSMAAPIIPEYAGTDAYLLSKELVFRLQRSTKQSNILCLCAQYLVQADLLIHPHAPTLLRKDVDLEKYEKMIDDRRGIGNTVIDTLNTVSFKNWESKDLNKNADIIKNAPDVTIFQATMISSMKIGQSKDDKGQNMITDPSAKDPTKSVDVGGGSGGEMHVSVGQKRIRVESHTDIEMMDDVTVMNNNVVSHPHSEEKEQAVKNKVTSIACKSDNLETKQSGTPLKSPKEKDMATSSADPPAQLNSSARKAIDVQDKNEYDSDESDMPEIVLESSSEEDDPMK